MQKEFLGLRTVIHKVSDLEKAKVWYSRVFNTVPYFDEPFYIGFDISGYELGLQPENEAMPKSMNIEVYWGVDDIQKTYERLLGIGATSVSKPTNVVGPIMVATVKDLWDNVFGIIYNPVFGGQKTE